MTTMTIEDQVAILMQGTEFGDDQLKQAMTDELQNRLVESEKNKKPLRVYCGYDPTSPDLHIGHTITMRKLRQFQELGHQAIFVIGSFTGIVGDASDRDKTRPRLSFDQVMKNAKTYTEQAFKILDSEKTEIRYNHEWLSEVTLEKFIDLAANFTVQQFLARDNFSIRYEKGNPIWLHEFFYALLQGYDASVLEADVQLGATEQLFNLLAGRKLQEALGQDRQVALTMPILVGLDGTMRMAKSTGNYIGIAEAPDEMYGKVMSLPDSAMGDYFRLVTRWKPDEITEIENELSTGQLHPRDVKMKLAREIVSIFHNDEAAEKAEGAFRRVFQEGSVPEDLPEVKLRADITLMTILLEADFASSKSEVRRLVSQRGVRLDDVVQEDPEKIINLEQPQTLRVGKRRFLKLIP